MGPVRADRLTDLTVEGLAVARITRLVLHDEITAPLRDPIVAWARRRLPPADGDMPTSMVELLKRPVAHPKVSYLLDCPWCMSIWAAPVVLGLRRWPLGRALIRLLALSEIAGVTEMAVGQLARTP